MGGGVGGLGLRVHLSRVGVVGWYTMIVGQGNIWYVTCHCPLSPRINDKFTNPLTTINYRLITFERFLRQV